MAYVTQAQLEAFITPEAVLAIYNDLNTGSVNTTSLNTILAISSSEVDSFLARNYAGPFPITGTAPEMVVHATLLWARALSYERHREYSRMYGAKPREDARLFCERLADAVNLMPDFTAQTKPSNVGGLIYDGSTRMVIDSPDGSRNGGDFG